MSITLERALQEISKNAYQHVHKSPDMDTLLEEVAELILSWRGKHEHRMHVELIQIGGVVANMLSRLIDESDLK